MGVYLRLLAWIVIIASVSSSGAIKFRIMMTPGNRRCYFQDMIQNSMTLISAKGAQESLKVGVEVHYGQTEVANKGPESEVKVAFSAPASADYSICFMTNSAGSVTVSIANGPEAKDYSELAKKEHLDPVVVGLRHSEDIIRDYHRHLLFLRARHSRMRHATDVASWRITMFSVITIMVLFTATLLQFIYLRSFLKRRKVI